MKNQRGKSRGEIKYLSEAERRETEEYIERYNEKLRKKDEVHSSIGRFIKYVLFTPLAIAANVVSMVFRVGGSIAAVGIPYGLYCIYKTIEQISAGRTIYEIKQTTFVCLFIIFPFTAFAVSFIFDKLSEYLTCYK